MKSVSKETELSYYGWVIVIMAFFGNLFAYGLAFAYGIFLKEIAAEFGWSRASIVSAFSIYAFTHNLFSPFAGWLTDKFGPRLTTAFGGLCLGASMILMGFVKDIWELYFYYTLVFGLGVASMYGPMMATVSHWFTQRRGMAIGLAVSGVGGGSLVFSPLVALIISLYGWRTSYMVIGTATLIMFIPITIFIRAPSRETVGIEGKHEGALSFSFMEALKTKALWIFSLSWLFIAMALWAIMIHMVPLLTDKGISLKMAGLLAGLIGAGSILGRIIAGIISDKLGRRQTILLTYHFQLIMLIWLLFSEGVWMFFIFALLFGVSSGGWGSALAAIPADYFGLRAIGAIFGLVIIIVGIGVGIGPYIGGYIFDKTHSYYYMVLICIFVTIVAIVLTLFLKSPAAAQCDASFN
jgi:MFS family permease